MLKEYQNNAFFWQKIDTLYFSSKMIITREKGSKHPFYPNLIYPVDYGHLEDTYPEETGIEAFKGSLKTNHVDEMVICADILKKDLEVKLIVGCTEEEERKILHFLNQTDFQKTVVLRRGDEIPNWAITD